MSPTRLLLALTLACGLQAQAPAPPEDPHQWLEGVTDPKALEWVKARNADALKELAVDPTFEPLKADLLKVLDSTARIPFITKHGAFYYNFWRDARNPKGLWRRTTLAEYRKADPRWEVILDLDKLGAEEHESWVWKGAEILKEGGHRHALIALSRGGADATVTREFDLRTRSFVKEGFNLPEAKGGATWIDRDTVFVSTDFGSGSMTTSGYPRIAKRWKRGTPLASAEVIYEGQATDLSISARHDDAKGFERDLIRRAIAFYDHESFLRTKDGRLHKLEVPTHAETRLHREWLFVQPRMAWTVGDRTYAGGSLLALKLEAFLAGKRDFAIVFQPTLHRTLASFSATRHHVLLNLLEDVKSSLAVATPGKGGWSVQPLQGAPRFSTASASAVDGDESDAYFMTVSGYLAPTSLSMGTLGRGKAEKLKAMPAYFDSEGLEVSQHFATSKDGTKVPYFQVAPKGVKLDGANPTLLYGYGGFEISLTPSYNANVGLAWLRKGGVYVVANIRGGGEYGPQWHQAALKEKRHRAYEDFAAVAGDLVARKVTSVKHLGAQGGSNGGLLMGNMITLYPDRFGAIVCQVPLLDMKRYSHLLAGASWMAEYGDPDVPAQWEYLRTFSPYQNLREGVKYPPVLFTTSTRDDRVHPGHARKMMARMMELGADVRSFENIEGGHGGAANNAQAAHMAALAYTFLWRQLGR